jgi:hypothetical protein
VFEIVLPSSPGAFAATHQHANRRWRISKRNGINRDYAARFLTAREDAMADAPIDLVPLPLSDLTAKQASQGPQGTVSGLQEFQPKTHSASLNHTNWFASGSRLWRVLPWRDPFLPAIRNAPAELGEQNGCQRLRIRLTIRLVF